jgi:hypothetical protein
VTGTSALPPDADQVRAANRPRSTLPSMPWVELLAFLIMIALCVTGGI